jgi:hypothetical protein
MVHRSGLVALVVAMGGTLALLIPGLSTAHQKRGLALERRDVEYLLKRASAGGVAIARVRALPGLERVDAPAWDGVRSFTVPVLPQAVAMPKLEQATITEVTVQALTDGRKVAWRLRWRDPSLDANVDSGRFCDAVALQFPLDSEPSFMMGNLGRRVEILHWKAIWQKDLDEHFQDVQDLHPNYWTDLYWFASGAFPYRIPDAFRDPTSRQWFIAESAGNPLAALERTTPVEELVAEGFGTLTHQAASSSDGRGVWRDGEWVVVLERPLRTTDPLDAQFHAGGGGQFAVAVWQGSDANSGGRKHHSSWLSYEIQG